MIEYTPTKINFTDIKNPSVILGGRIALDTYEDWIDNIVDTNKAIINAIDIDWNGAYIESINTYINSTEDLLSQINFIYTQLDDLSQGNGINLDDYLKTEDLTTQLLTSKLNNVFASKSIEDSITELSNALNDKANSTDIPKSIYQLQYWDNFLTRNQLDTILHDFSSAYDIYKYNGGTLEQDAWLESLHGTDGTNGLSAYELAQLYEGYTGSIQEWLNSLKGTNGYSAYQLAYNDDPTIGSLQDWLASLKGETGAAGLPGEDGKSAFELAQETGFTGTKEEWLISLKGETGATGPMGPGINIIGYYDTLEELQTATEHTINGIGDAYNVGGIVYIYNDQYTSIDNKWKSAGSFKGETGPQGKSAYQIYVEVQESLGKEYLSEIDWLNSLKGEQGEQGIQGIQGKDAYEVYADVQIALGNTPMTREQWIEQTLNGNTYTAGQGININDNVISVVYREVSDVWGIE